MRYKFNPTDKRTLLSQAWDQWKFEPGNLEDIDHGVSGMAVAYWLFTEGIEAGLAIAEEERRQEEAKCLDT